MSSGDDSGSGRSSGGSLPLFVSSAAASSPSAPSSARRSLERIAADRTGRADRDDAFVESAESVVRVSTPRRRDPPGGAPVAKSAANANANPASTRSRDDRLDRPDRLKTRSVTLPPPAAPGADDAVTRLRGGSRGSDATGSSVSSAGSFRSALEEGGGGGGGDPRDSRDGIEPLETGASVSRDDASRVSSRAVVASSPLYRGGLRDKKNRNRHVRRHSAHVDAAALARALLATRRDVAAAARGSRETGTHSHGAPVFGALLARRAEDEDLWRRAFEGHPPLDVLGHEESSRGMTPRRRSLSAGDLAAALAKESPSPPPFEEMEFSRGSAA